MVGSAPFAVEFGSQAQGRVDKMVPYFAYSSELTGNNLVFQIGFEFLFGPQYPSLQNDAKNCFAVDNIRMLCQPKPPSFQR